MHHRSDGPDKPLAGIENLLRIYENPTEKRVPQIEKVINFLDSLCNFGRISFSNEGAKPNTFEIRTAEGVVFNIHDDGSNDRSLHELKARLEHIKAHMPRTPVAAAEAHLHHNKHHEPGTHISTHIHIGLPDPHLYPHGKDHKEHHKDAHQQKEHSPCAVQPNSLHGIEGHIKFCVSNNFSSSTQVEHIYTFLKDYLSPVTVTTITLPHSPQGDFDVVFGGQVIWSLKKEGLSEHSLKLLLKALTAVKESESPR